MSKHWSNPLLWGHYADSYKGVVLGFDVSSEKFTKVDYQVERPRLTGKLSEKRALTEEEIELILYTKFRDWSYEEEYRWFLPLGPPDTVSGLHFQPWGDNMVLKEVIIGPRSELTRVRIDLVLGVLSSEVKPIRARPAFESYRVIEAKLASAWPKSQEASNTVMRSSRK